MPESSVSPRQRFDAAAQVLERCTREGSVAAATLHVQYGGDVMSESFGAATSRDDVFLIASITKPMTSAALMTLLDKGEFMLDDPVQRFLPEMVGGGKQQITIQHLLSHVSGLPDQLPENEQLRRDHAKLTEFVERAIRTPLLFEPGSRYRYSSMGILLAAEVGRRITGINSPDFVDQTVFQPLGMTRSAMGLGEFQLEETICCQVRSAAVESGAGDPGANDWDWNSRYWRELGAPWGGALCSAADVARFLAEFLHPTGTLLKPETIRLMVRNHNRPGLTPYGLGFSLGPRTAGRGCSQQTFGHGGATGTLAWADPASDTICVVLTTLPYDAVDPHPRQVVSDHVAG